MNFAVDVVERFDAVQLWSPCSQPGRGAPARGGGGSSGRATTRAYQNDLCLALTAVLNPERETDNVQGLF